MQGKAWLSTGLACALGLVALERPAAGSAAEKSATPTPAVKSTAVKKSRPAPIRPAAKIVRAQNNPFEEEFQPESETTGRARVTQVSATEPAVEAAETTEQTPVTQPVVRSTDASTETPTEGAGADSAALKRLKYRSAKDRMEQVHQEWLRNKKERESKGADLQPGDSVVPPSKSATADPFVADPAETTQPGLPPEAANVELPGDSAGPADAAPDGVPVERPIRAPQLESGRVRLQSQPKPLNRAPTEEELTKLYQGDNDARLAAPVRDPSKLPRITEIHPVPQTRNPTPGRQIPEENSKDYVQLGHTPYTPRVSPEFLYTWEATNFHHQPLYFEDPALERYGHTLPPYLQPFVSIGKFSGQVALLPYQMALNPPWARISPLGWYAPGDYVPYKMYQVPLNAKAAATEAAVILGVKFATP